MNRTYRHILPYALSKRPNAIAEISGSPDYPDITGTVRFYNTQKGVVVYAVIEGLPYSREKCAGRIFAFHIHDGTECSGNETDPFLNAGTHFNPDNCPHPYHAGDFPALFGNDGLAISAFLTDRFSVPDILGKAVIIHALPDDYKTQPSGNSGTKIACGIIKR